jgi:phospholipid/cholesterol/gamma-HCH transport system permease protein
MAAVTKPLRVVGSATSGLGNSAEEIGRQLGFYVRILSEILRGRWIRRRYLSQLFGMISDITIGASALIVGGGMVFVIFSMSFFTGTEVGLQGFKGLEQIGAQDFTGLVGAPTPGRSPR